MSRWFPDTVVVGLRPAPASVLAADDVQPRWTDALAVLERQLDALAPKPRTRWLCAVAAEFVRYQIVPWTAEFAEGAARAAFVQHCFEEVHGPVCREWTFRHSQPRHGAAALACAIDSALLDRLTAIAAARRLVLKQVQPTLMQAFNRDRRSLPIGPGWFVLSEGPWLTLLLMDRDEPQQVRMHRAPPSRLAPLLAREWSALGFEEPLCPVHVAAPLDETPLPGVPVHANAPLGAVAA